MDEDEIRINILKENIAFQKHQETQRMWTANIFIAIVVGTLVYSINTGIEQIPWFVPLIFFIISTICLLINLKLCRVFTKTQGSIKSIFSDISIFSKKKSKAAIWESYMAGFQSKETWWKTIRIRNLYVILYALAIAGSGYWLYTLNEPVLWTTAVSTVVIIAAMYGITKLVKK